MPIPSTAQAKKAHGRASRTQPASSRPAQQRRDSQRKGNRTSGIAEEHHGRVQQHRRMLQQRTKPGAVVRDREAGLHRVGAEHHHRHQETLVGHQDSERRLAQWARRAARPETIDRLPARPTNHAQSSNEPAWPTQNADNA